MAARVSDVIGERAYTVLNARSRIYEVSILQENDETAKFCGIIRSAIHRYTHAQYIHKYVGL